VFSLVIDLHGHAHGWELVGWYMPILASLVTFCWHFSPAQRHRRAMRAQREREEIRAFTSNLDEQARHPQRPPRHRLSQQHNGG
jgi:hypothetical protein